MTTTVNAYARILRSKMKLKIINEQAGNIYYTYTDSIVTYIKLASDMVSGNELALLKLEYLV